MSKLIDILRIKRPGLARRVDLGHPLAAVRMFCLQCVGGSALDVKRCRIDDCRCTAFASAAAPGPSGARGS